MIGQKKMVKKVSIIIAAYNYEEYIEECLFSCLNQVNVTKYEVIVINDGSTDQTLNGAKKFKNNDKLHIYSINNSGIEAASNFGIRQASGEYVVRVDADDKLAENYLEVMLSVLEEVSCTFYYSDYYEINKESVVTNTSELPEFDKKEIVKRGDFLATGTLYKKEKLIEVGLYDVENPNCGLENFELILKLLAKGYTGYKVDKPLFYYRRHGKNLSAKKRKKIIQYGNKLADQFNLKGFQTNKFHPYNLKLKI